MVFRREMKHRPKNVQTHQCLSKQPQLSQQLVTAPQYRQTLENKPQCTDDNDDDKWNERHRLRFEFNLINSSTEFGNK